MYFLPLPPNTRFAAFRDLPGVESELSQFTATARTWEELLANATLTANMVTATPRHGILFDLSGTYVVSEMGMPQLEFANNPKSLLFVWGSYTVASGTSAYAYERMKAGYTRWEISPHHYDPAEETLEDVYEDIEGLQTTKADLSDLAEMEARITQLQATVDRLRTRQDPMTVVGPYIASEQATRAQKDRDIQEQIDLLQPTGATLDFTNVYDKNDIDTILSNYATIGYVDSQVLSRASKTDLDNHRLAQAPHGTTAADVGAPTTFAHQAALDLINDARARLTILEAKTLMTGLTTEGDVLATPQANGVWKIDSTQVDTPNAIVIAHNGLVSPSQNVFNLSVTPSGEVLVFRNGELALLSHFFVEGNVLTYTGPLATGDRIVVVAA
jgi:hypothetical protein